jgi:hypothetical protein
MDKEPQRDPQPTKRSHKALSFYGRLRPSVLADKAIGSYL